MKLPTLSLTLVLACVASLFMNSCDERKEADVLPEIYKLINIIDPPGDALDVDAAGSYLAVAAASSGSYLYNVSDPRNPQEIFHHQPQGILYSAQCVIDPVNHLLFSISAPSTEAGDKYPIHNFDTGERIGGLNFSGLPRDVQAVYEADSFVVWNSDATDGFVASLWCRSQTGTWTPNCPYVWSWNFDLGQRGFHIVNDLAAIAMNTYRVAIHDLINNAELSATGTPGDPQDCAWYGNHIVVADNFYMTILDATIPAAPTVVASIIVPGADRLSRVMMDGNNAVLLDDSDGIYVVCICDILHPEVLQSISLPEPAAFSISNEYLYVADQQLGVLVYSH